MLDANEVFSLLERASLHGDQVAMTTLQAMGSGNQALECKGYASALANIISQGQSEQQHVSIDANRQETRLMASILLKNLVDKMYVSRGTRDDIGFFLPSFLATSLPSFSHPITFDDMIGEDEKVLLRTFCYSQLGERDNRIATQIANVCSRVIRHDWPASWPDAISSLLNYIVQHKSIDTGLLRMRALGILHETLFQLSIKKLSGHRQQLCAALVGMYPSLCELWGDMYIEFRQFCAASNAQLFQAYTQTQAAAASQTNIQNILSVMKTLSMQLCMMTKILVLILSQFYLELMHLPCVVQFLGAPSALETAASDGGDVNFLTYYQLVVWLLQSWAAHPNIIGDALEDYDGSSIDVDEACSASGIIKTPPEFASEPLKEIIFVFKIMVESVSAPILNDLIIKFPLEFSSMLAQFVNFAYSQLTVMAASAHPVPGGNKLNISCTMLLSSLLKCHLYTNSSEQFMEASKKMRISTLGRKLGGDVTFDEKMQEQAAIYGHDMRQAFFTADRIESLYSVIVNHLLKLSQRDIDEWVGFPEEFLACEESSTAKDRIISAGEDLYLNLLEFFPDQIASFMMTLLQSSDLVASSSSSVFTQREKILFYDAIFTCTGIGCSKLHPYLGDVSAWLQASIAPLVSLMVNDRQIGAVASSDGDDQLAHVMLRRLLWLLCCWSYLIPPAMLPDICKLTHSILDMSLKSKDSQEPDVVVMFQVIITIQTITNVQDFTSDMIVNEFSALVENLCGFTQLLGDSDHRAQVVDLIGELILIIGVGIQPIMEPICMYLSQLWSSTDPHSPVRSSILLTLQQIIRCSGIASDVLHPIAHTLLTSVYTDESLSFLRGEASLLWLALTRYSQTYTVDLDSIFKESTPRLFSLENEDIAMPESELMKNLMMIIEAYAILGGATFIESCKNELRSIFHFTIVSPDPSQREPRMTPMLMRPIEAMFMVPSSSQTVTAFLLREYPDVCIHAIRVCASKMDSFQGRFSTFEEKDISTVIYLSVICRLLLNDNTAFLTQASAVLNSTGIHNGEEIFIHSLVRLLVDMFDKCEFRVGGVYHQKLWIRTLLIFYPTDASNLVNMFFEVVNAGISLLASIKEDEKVKSSDMGRSMATINMISRGEQRYDEDEDDEDENPSPELINIAFKQILSTDSITNLDVSSLLLDTVQKMSTVIGNEQYAQLHQSVSMAGIGRF